MISSWGGLQILLLIWNLQTQSNPSETINATFHAGVPHLLYMCNAVFKLNILSSLTMNLFHGYSNWHLPSGAFWVGPSAQPLFLDNDLSLPSNLHILTVSISWPYGIYLDHWPSLPSSPPPSSRPVDNYLGVVKLTFSLIFNMEIGQGARARPI